MAAAARQSTNGAPSSAPSAPIAAYVDLARVMEPAELGLSTVSGVTFAPEGSALLIAGTTPAGAAVLQAVSPLERVLGSTALAADGADGDLAFDGAADQVLTVGREAELQTMSAPGGRPGHAGVGRTVAVHGVSLTGADGAAATQAGTLFVLDAHRGRVLELATSSRGRMLAGEIALTGTSDMLTGLALGLDGHLFSLGSESDRLHEFDGSGALVATRDLAGYGLDAPGGIVLAPSGDTSDASDTMSLYVADRGTSDGTGSGLYEFALSEPALSPQVSAATVNSMSVVETFSTGAGSTWNPDSPDPSGLAYLPASEVEVDASRRDRIVSADGEVEETTGAGWNGVNVWFAPRTGATNTATMNTTVAPTNPTNNEPVGAAYDPVRNEIYFSKDGSSGRVWVYNAVTLSQVRSFLVSGAPYNNADAEGLAFGNGVLYMADALDNDLVKVLPGGDGIVGTGGDDVVANYDLTQFGQSEPEGLDVHPTTGNVWIVSNKESDPMLEVSPNGALVSTTSIAAADPDSPGGLAIAPRSDGGSGYNVYVADRGVDNLEVPSENDGRIYEFNVTVEAEPTPPTANFSWAQAPGTLTVNFTDTSTGLPSEWLWDFGDGTTPAEHDDQHPSHAYASAGSYQVTLTAANSDGSDSITKSVTVSPIPPVDNLLLNSSFEDDVDSNTRPDQWTTKSKFTRSNATTPHSGVFVGRHFATNNTGYTVQQQVAVSGGTTYRYGAWVNIPSTSDAFGFALRLKWLDSAGNRIKATTVHQFTAATAGWQQVTTAMTAPPNAVNAQVMMVVTSLNGTIYVDDFSFGP